MEPLERLFVGGSAATSMRARIAGTSMRVELVARVLAGAVLAPATLPAADPLQNRASPQVGLDAP